MKQARDELAERLPDPDLEVGERTADFTLLVDDPVHGVRGGTVQHLGQGTTVGFAARKLDIRGVVEGKRE